MELDKSIQFSEEEKVTRAEILEALKCVDANWSFQSAFDKGKQFCLMFPDSQIAKGYKPNETKMKYMIQFDIAPYFRDLLKFDLKNIPYSFKFDKTMKQQTNKQYSGYT